MQDYCLQVVALLALQQPRGTAFSPFYTGEVVAQLRICGYSGQTVPRHVYFGNYGNKLLLSVIHDFAYVILRIIPRIFVAILVDALTADLCQPWVSLDFDTPSLIIAEMKMQCVYLLAPG